MTDYTVFLLEGGHVYTKEGRGVDHHKRGALAVWEVEATSPANAVGQALLKAHRQSVSVYMPCTRVCCMYADGLDTEEEDEYYDTGHHP